MFSVHTCSLCLRQYFAVFATEKVDCGFYFFILSQFVLYELRGILMPFFPFVRKMRRKRIPFNLNKRDFCWFPQRCARRMRNAPCCHGKRAERKAEKRSKNMAFINQFLCQNYYFLGCHVLCMEIRWCNLFFFFNYSFVVEMFEWNNFKDFGWKMVQ